MTYLSVLEKNGESESFLRRFCPVEKDGKKIKVLQILLCQALLRHKKSQSSDWLIIIW